MEFYHRGGDTLIVTETSSMMRVDGQFQDGPPVDGNGFAVLLAEILRLPRHSPEQERVMPCGLMSKILGTPAADRWTVDGHHAGLPGGTRLRFTLTGQADNMTWLNVLLLRQPCLEPHWLQDMPVAGHA